MDKEIERLKEWAKELKHVNYKPKRFLRNGRAIYNAEVKFLLEIMRQGSDAPKAQDTDMLQEAAEYRRQCEEDGDDEEDDDEEEADNAEKDKADPEERSADDDDDDDDDDDFNLNNLKTFYYRGSKETVERCSKKDKICKCVRWHVIVDCEFYSLVDRSYTLFEMLKGNGYDESGPILFGKFFDKNGDVAGRYKWDTIRGEYSILFR